LLSRLAVWRVCSLPPPLHLPTRATSCNLATVSLGLVPRGNASLRGVFAFAPPRFPACLRFCPNRAPFLIIAVPATYVHRTPDHLALHQAPPIVSVSRGPARGTNEPRPSGRTRQVLQVRRACGRVRGGSFVPTLVVVTVFCVSLPPHTIDRNSEYHNGHR
jgi:hypothetical protein